MPRVAGPRATTAAQYQEAFRIAYAEPSGPHEGTVTLDAVIGKDGAVHSLAFRAGDPELADAAMETVRHWKYRPLKLNGRPVEVATEIDVSFTL